MLARIDDSRVFFVYSFTRNNPQVTYILVALKLKKNVGNIKTLKYVFMKKSITISLASVEIARDGDVVANSLSL